jgi:hypothetical protein
MCKPEFSRGVRHRLHYLEFLNQKRQWGRTESIDQIRLSKQRFNLYLRHDRSSEGVMKSTDSFAERRFQRGHAVYGE